MAERVPVKSEVDGIQVEKGCLREALALLLISSPSPLIFEGEGDKGGEVEKYFLPTHPPRIVMQSAPQILLKLPL
ncbi:MAG: hypothetical protein GH158_02010 [Dehalococcoidia bacterium]|nr:hypothetical protein [Dehalococcoidia bacterium]